MKLFELFATLGLDLSPFEADAEAAYEKADNIGSKIGRVLGEAIGAGTNVALGIAAVTNQAAELAKGASDTTGHIDDMAQKLGISTKAYQEFAYVFAQSGLNVDQFANSFVSLQKVMAGFGTDKQKGALNAIGLALEDIENLSVEHAFSLVISKLSQMENEAERTAASVDLLGGSAANLPALLNQGPTAIAELIQEAHALGLILDEGAVLIGAEMGDEINKYNASLEGMKTQIGAQFLPVFTEFLAALNEAAVTFMPAFLSALEELAPILSNLIDSGLDVFVSLVQWCVDHTEEIGAMLATAAVGFAAIQIATNPIVGIIYAIMGASLLLIANWESIKETAIEIWNSITSAIENAISSIKNFLGLNAEASQTSVHASKDGASHGGAAGKYFASGISYVPRDDYAAYLHRGEAVLTRQDAEEWRSGSRASSEDITALRADILALGDRLDGMAVYLGRDKVGNVLSRDMAKEARTGRRYGV